MMKNNKKYRWVFAFLAIVLLLSFSHNTSAQTSKSEYLSKLPPLIDREMFFGDPEISGAQLSPDGKFMSFIKPYKDVRNIYVKGIDEPFEAAKPITADKRPVPGYFWSQDSRYVLYVQDKGGNENFHVYAVNPVDKPEPETGVPLARDLTPIEGVRAYIYSVPKNKPNEIIVGLNNRDAAYHDVYRLNLTTGERELLLTNTEKVADFTFDLEGNVRLATRQTDDGGTEILRIHGNQFTPIYNCNYAETCSPYRFHKDGKRVYLITNKGDNVDLTRLVLLNPETGKVTLVESDPEGQVDFQGALFAEDTDDLIATFYVGDRVRIYPKENQLKRDLGLLRKKLQDGELRIYSITHDMRLFLISISRDVDPGSVYLYDRKTGNMKFQYRQRPELKSEYLAFVKPVRYKARDGMEIPGYLTLPRGVEPKNMPTVILPHGGPWARDIWGYDPYSQFLANRGYAVFQPNFRGSTGYGKKFLNAGNKQWGTGYMQHDISDCVKYLVEKGIADPQGVAIFGGSYGGYATLAGLAFTPELYAAGISYVGPSNLITLLNSIPPYWGPIVKIFHVRLGDPNNPDDQKRLKAQSPLFSADAIQAPLLVIQGANDPRVKKAESEMIVAALRDRGRPVEYLLADDEGHGFRGRENRLAVAVAMERFFSKHLGGRYQKDLSDDLAAKMASLTVDIHSVKLEDKTLATYAETAPLPERSADVLQPLHVEYATQMEIQGQKLNMETIREVKEADLKSTPVWSIISKTESPMGSAVDTFYVDKKTLLPLKRFIYQGPAVVKLEYLPNAIKGDMKMGGQSMPIALSLAAPVMGEGSALEVTIAALPLAPGYETTLRTFDPMTQKVRPMFLKVTGKETIEVPSGSFQTYLVELTPLDGETGGGSMNISLEAPRCLVRYTAKLPATAGGGTMIMELKNIQ